LGSAPVADVKTVWAHELSGFMQSKEAWRAVNWAKNNLPERCPNAVEFRNLCRLAPAAEAPRLPEPPADPVRVAQALSKLSTIRGESLHQPVGRKDWAHRLIARVEQGDKTVTHTAITMARHALGSQSSASAPLGV
jgi:hypothetical protein